MRFLLRVMSCGTLALAVGACSSDDDSGGKQTAGTGGVGQVGGSSGSAGTAGGAGGAASGGTGNATGSGATGGSGNVSGSSGTGNVSGTTGDAGETSSGGRGGTPPTPGTCTDYTSKLDSCEIMSGSVDCSVPLVGEYLPCVYGCYAAAPCGQIVDGTCGSDTSNPFVDCMVVCDDLSFDCGGGQTVPAGFQCDAVPDCDNGADENGCPPFESMFACGDGSSIPAGFRCDGFEDCNDAADESDCPSVMCPPPPVPPAGEACAKAEKTLEGCGVLPGGVMTSCLDRTAQAACEKTCLADASCTDVVAYLCEGEGADALVACLEGCQSQSDYFPCGDGSIIPSLYLCDDVLDCNDGADEADCAFACTGGGVVPYTSLCDGTSDCKDGSDEDGCAPTCPAP